MPHNLAIIGMSTGGPRMMQPLFSGMPALNCSMVLVQHMPAFVNPMVVDKIHRYSSMKGKLAADNDRLELGTVYIAPSNVHLRLSRNNTIHLAPGPKVNFVCPAIDVAMESVIPAAGTIIAGAVLTGMGRDGARGIAHLKGLGAVTMAQNQETCVIFSMPRAAIETGCVDLILPPEKIKDKLIEIFGVLGSV